MPRIYKPRPCKTCGADKGSKGESGHKWYCRPCADEAWRVMWRRHRPWWCGACASPRTCIACARSKRERMVASLALRSARRLESGSGYFRPLDAERWWQQRSHAAVQGAVKRGLLPNLKTGEYACTDCGGVAHEYDHRDYARPFDVEPVCRSCNKQRGTASWPTAERFAFVKLRSAGQAA